MTDTTGRRALQRRLHLEMRLAYLSAAMGVLTVLWNDWIEVAFHIDPDNGSGALEWGLVAIFVAASVVLATVARRDRRRLLGLTATRA